MFKIVSLIIWLILITLSLIWFFNNNGWIDITWLGYEIKIDILTFLVLVVLFLAVTFLIYRFYSFMIAVILGVFGIFRVTESQKREREIEKYETSLELLTSFLKAINENDVKEAKLLQKRLHLLLENEELNQELRIQIENKFGVSRISEKLN